MAKIINATTTTIDGVSDVSDWFIAQGSHMDSALEVFRSCSAMLLGRTTFEGLIGAWAGAEGDWADTINPMPKWVISRTRSGPQEWNGTAVAGDAVETVAKIKAEQDGTIFMSGCGELARTLLGAGLIDEVFHNVHPRLVGTGGRAFEGAKVDLELVSTETFDTGVVRHLYVPAR